MTNLATPVSGTPQKPSKRPPPLPPMAMVAATPASPDDSTVEELFFLEGVDGHAESLPSSEPGGLVRDDCSLDRHVLGEEDFEEIELEDPARTRRRRLARLGVGWGTVGVMILAATAIVMRPRAHEPVALSSESSVPTMVHAVAAAPVPATPSTPAPAPMAAATPSAPQPSLHGVTASATTASTTRARAAAPAKGAHASSPANAKRAPSASPKGPTLARSTRARTAAPSPKAATKSPPAAHHAAPAPATTKAKKTS